MASGQEKSIDGDVITTFMGEIDICDRNLAQTSIGPAKNPCKKKSCDPLSVCLRIWYPNHDDHGGKDGKQVDWLLAVLQSYRLSEKTAPAQETIL